MKGQCSRIEEQLWEHARTSRSMPEAVDVHIANCPRCAATLRESELLVHLLREAGRVTTAPDCRPAVMSKISRVEHRRMPRWLYATAAACFAVGIPVMFFTHQSRCVRMAQQSAVTTPTSDTCKPFVAQAKASPPTGRPATPFHQQDIKSTTDEPTQSTNMAKAKPTKGLASLRGVTKKQQSAPVSEVPAGAPADATTDTEENAQPVVAIYVKWDTQEYQDDESIYVYVEHDDKTGDTTTCSARRSGDCLEIHIESKPDDQEEPKTRGCLTVESNRDA